jgi:hypothetical protein
MKLKKQEGVVVSKDYVSTLLMDYTNDIIARVRAFTKEWLTVAFNDIKDVNEVVDFRSIL